MRAPTFDMTGQRFGRLVVVGLSSGQKHRTYWDVQCDCGAPLKRVQRGALLRGTTRSCGCLSNELRVRALTTHGCSKSATYSIWTGMHNRCRPDHEDHERYFDRGIRVCDRWKSYEMFLADMGERPDRLSIDRCDNDGNYEPGNCRWATQQQQSRNTSINRILTLAGESLPLTEWAERYRLPLSTLCNRLNSGWDLAEAITSPPDTRRKKSPETLARMSASAKAARAKRKASSRTPASAGYFTAR